MSSGGQHCLLQEATLIRTSGSHQPSGCVDRCCDRWRWQGGRWIGWDGSGPAPACGENGKGQPTGRVLCPVMAADLLNPEVAPHGPRGDAGTQLPEHSLGLSTGASTPGPHSLASWQHFSISRGGSPVMMGCNILQPPHLRRSSEGHSPLLAADRMGAAVCRGVLSALERGLRVSSSCSSACSVPTAFPGSLSPGGVRGAAFPASFFRTLACGTRCRSVCILRSGSTASEGGRGRAPSARPLHLALLPSSQRRDRNRHTVPGPRSSSAGRCDCRSLGRLRAAAGSRAEPGSSGKWDRLFGQVCWPPGGGHAPRSPQIQRTGDSVKRQRPGTRQAPAGTTSRRAQSRSRSPGLATGRWLGPGLPSVSRSPQPRRSRHACLSWFLTKAAGTPCVPSSPDQFWGAPGSLRVSVWGWGGLSVGRSTPLSHAPS